MVEPTLHLVELDGGRSRGVPPDIGRVLIALLGSPGPRGHLRRHGLDITEGASGLRVSAAELYRAWARALGSGTIPGEFCGFVGRDTVEHLGRTLAQWADPTGDSGDWTLVLVQSPGIRRGLGSSVRETGREELAQFESVESSGHDGALALLARLAEEGVVLPVSRWEQTLIPLLNHPEHAPLAAEILSRQGGLASADAFEAGLASTLSPRTRGAFLTGLIRQGRRALGFSVLRTMLTDHRRASRQCALGIMAEIAVPDDGDELREALRIAPAPERAMIASLLVYIGDPAGYAPLMKALSALGDGTPRRVLVALLRGVERTNSTRFSSAVQAVADRLSDAFLSRRAAQIAKALTSGRDERTPEALLTEAHNAHEAGAGQRALRLLSQHLALTPQSPNGHLLHGLLLRGRGQSAEALGAIEVSLTQDSKQSRAHRVKGSLLWDQGEHAAALASYERALALNPTDGFSWFYLGFALRRTGRYAEAAPCLERARTLEPLSPSILIESGHCLDALGRGDEALSRYRRAARVRPTDPRIPFWIGTLHCRAARYEPALSSAERALSLDRDFPGALRLKAQALEALGRRSAGDDLEAPGLEGPEAAQSAVESDRTESCETCS